MALAEVPGSFEPRGWFVRGARLLSPAAIPPPALVLLGVVSVQVGAGLAKQLFVVLPPTAVVLLRLATSALVLGFLSRRALRTLARDHTWGDLAVAAAFGLTLAVMNTAIYQSFARIPLGVAVTIEFLGPLVVAIAASRRLLDLVWAALAFAGVLLLARGDGNVDLVGVAFALLAGAAWAGYILLSAATGRRFAGSSGLAVASVLAAVVMLPLGTASGGTALLDPWLLLLGLGVGLMSSVIPYTLELEALRRMPARVFGILMSLEPAVAALVGLVVLGEILAAQEWAAIGCVMIACVGATRGRPEPPEAVQP
ncbi:inner membrane transporter RhtA [Thermomonospora echinospora]|uniref:Inner membrane transporter RhtA n=1 Tax=Thermomonospora echinospora TaxID=1992 RepID=A0A1H6BX30_9ACTN|nr:EamA family transporter [Thermomonospora echinospora]SEG65202.1 inner membrane transporter RhtA [Thermomonospora echinospora]